MPGENRARRRNLALDLPIAWRLTLGFALAGIVAALAAGIVGEQRSAALAQQSVFYQSLLQINTNLSTGASYLQLMDVKMHDILTEEASSAPSTETLTQDEQDTPRLAAFYDAILIGYSNQDLLSQQPNQLSIVRMAGDMNASARQIAVLSSAVRTWQAYQTAQTAVLQSITAGDIPNAVAQERLYAEPTNADAQSALRSLLQFNGSLAKDVRLAATIEETNLTLASAVAALLAFAAVAVIGWFISQTIVRRLGLLRAVTRAVGEGRTDARAPVIGRDEIGDVTESVNGMLDTIVGLLEETRRQRDALTGAAERLFTDMRVASGGDLRVQARASSDPIGLLGNAFNLTIGRFKRLLSRTHVSTSQIATLARHQIDRADSFIYAVRGLTPPASGISRGSAPSADSQGGVANNSPRFWSNPSAYQRAGGAQSQPASDALQRLGSQISNLASADAGARAQEAFDVAQQAYLSGGRLMQLTQVVAKPDPRLTSAQVVDAMMDELRRLETLLKQLGRTVYAMRAANDTIAQEMRDALTQLAAAPAISAPPAGAPGVERMAMPDTQLFEFIHLASTFAQETTALARQSLVVAEEMRVSVAPFQYDQPSPGSLMADNGGARYSEAPGPSYMG
jgi:methyl-accepting chemotaxis protein